MLVGAIGRMGSGKTLSTVALALQFHFMTKLPLYCVGDFWLNSEKYNIEYQNIRSLDDLKRVSNAIIFWDEAQESVDSRNRPSDNIPITHFIAQSRKKDILLIYNTQFFSQVDKRLRLATQWLIYCEKNIYSKVLRLKFFEMGWGEGKEYNLRDVSMLFDVYNHKQVIESIV